MVAYDALFEGFFTLSDGLKFFFDDVDIGFFAMLALLAVQTKVPIANFVLRLFKKK